MDFSRKGPVIWSLVFYFIVSLENLLNKQLNCRWFELPQCSCNATVLGQDRKHIYIMASMTTENISNCKHSEQNTNCTHRKKVWRITYRFIKMDISSYMHKLDFLHHYNDIIMGAIASQITSLTIVYSSVYSDADQRKHQSSTSLAFVWGIHWEPVNSPHKWPVTQKMLPFDDVIIIQ